MPLHRPRLDHTLPLALQGYGWLPNQRRRSTDGVVDVRLMGQRAVGLCGPDAARFFYDEEHVARRTALPEPVQGTLFGHGPVHTLDGSAHRVRKAMFLALMTPDGIARLVDLTTTAWDKAAGSWTSGRDVVLFDEAGRIITGAVCEWAGIPLDGADSEVLAADLVALVDGFATLGPRHWRARRARGRREDWLADLVGKVRNGEATVPVGSAVEAVARHRDVDGQPLDPRRAAVELLNVIRPTAAVCWFVAYAGHALHRWPQYRARLSEDDPAFTEAFVHELRRFYPYAFRPERFIGRQLGEFDLVPQGGGDPRTGHRCPGEGITVALLQALVVRLARMEYEVPRQDLTISLRRIPARPRSGLVLRVVRPSGF